MVDVSLLYLVTNVSSLEFVFQKTIFRDTAQLIVRLGRFAGFVDFARGARRPICLIALPCRCCTAFRLEYPLLVSDPRRSLRAVFW